MLVVFVELTHIRVWAFIYSILHTYMTGGPNDLGAQGGCPAYQHYRAGPATSAPWIGAPSLKFTFLCLGAPIHGALVADSDTLH